MTEKYTGTAKQWEDGVLGADEEYLVQSSLEDELALDDALGLKAISIRLPERLIRNLKLIAQVHGIGYQPLIRDVLNRFSRSEIRHLLIQLEEEKRLENVLSDDDSPAAKYMEAKCA